MQLNVYIPKEKEYLLAALVAEAERTGRSKNEIVLQAIERQLAPGKPAYRIYPLAATVPDRADLYAERLE
jgi:hypothetical protein